LLGIVLYVWASFALVARGDEAETEEEFASEIGSEEMARDANVWGVAGVILGGLLLLVAGSHFFQMGGVSIAQRFGVSEAVIGLTLLAFGTSLPELATSIVASIKRQGDIIAGNAVGSSVFNILAILGITVLVKPMLIGGIEPFDLAFMVGSAVVVVGLMATRKKLARWEGGVLLCAYVGYVVTLINRGAVGG